MDDRTWHHIRKNEITRIPVRHVFIDTEAFREYRQGLEVQRWRCGVAIYAERKRNGTVAQSCHDYLNAENMWRDVSNFVAGKGRIVVWAHNLAYDIRTSGMLEVLPQLGWILAGHNIASRGTWLEFKRGKETLVACDSFSVFPTGIARLGEWFGMGKPELPSDDADMGTWLDRCRSDCAILATAVLGYLQWIKEEDLGNWQITGNGQAWAVFRHRFLTHEMTVHSDVDALAAERKAMWTGRCEAFWHGELADQRIYEFDFTTAYPRIARDNEVPVKLVGVIDNPDALKRVFDTGRHAVLSEVEITTDLPVVPTTREGRICWPTGTFTTTLWDPEIRSAMDAGAEVTFRKGWVYRKAYALQAWADWILKALADSDDAVPAWQKSVLKHWSRALIGRMAMTYQAWEEIGTSDDSRVEAGLMHTEATGEVVQFLQVGKTMFVHAGQEDWKHAMPMVTGYVQSIARVQLWNVLARMPFRSVLYVDTDGLFVTQEFVPEVEEIAATMPACGLRLKRCWEGIAIYGPRQIITGQEVRIAGVPKRAERVGKKEFEGEVWESLSTALRFGNTHTVRVRDRKWTITGVDHRRKGTGFGWTEPWEMTIAD